MKKTEQIMTLHSQGKTTWEIAREVYALPNWASREDVDRKAAYVRVVLRQRNGRGLSKTDERYLKRRYGTRTVKEAHKLQARERYADPVLRARHQAIKRASYARKRLAAQANQSTA